MSPPIDMTYAKGKPGGIFRLEDRNFNEGPSELRVVFSLRLRSSFDSAQDRDDTLLKVGMTSVFIFVFSSMCPCYVPMLCG